MTYEAGCKKCGRRYIGETLRNGFTRGREHMEGIAKKNKESPFVVHSEQRHGERARFEDYERTITGNV